MKALSRQIKGGTVDEYYTKSGRHSKMTLIILSGQHLILGINIGLQPSPNWLA